MEADFSGYATKAGLKCSDGRTIMPEAFQQSEGLRVPLVWQHGHTDPDNVLGHAILEARKDGVYARAFFNTTDKAQTAKKLVQHKDITMLSIYANQLIERNKQVFHGVIRELSLVLAGANPGALIDNVNLAHADGDVEVLDDEAVIYTGLPFELQHADAPADNADAEVTAEDVYNSMNEDQKNLMHLMLAEVQSAADKAVSHSADDEVDGDADEESDDESDVVEDAVPDDAPDEASDAPNDESDDESEDTNDKGDVAHTEGNEDMSRNVFEQNGITKQDRKTLTHDQLKTIMDDAKKMGSYKESFLEHAVEYGIENIDFLFPDAKTLSNTPELITRRQEWVAGVINGVKKSPFSRIKSISADLTLDDARAKGYVKGTLKKEEWFALQKRVTTPTTIYKKQKLDRDDIIDITDLDVVAWLKAEMRIMLDEEIARAILVGDGREIDNDDKVDEGSIRPIAYEDDFYAHKTVIPANLTGDAVVEAIVRARPNYRGTGNPTMFTTEGLLTDMLLIKDKMGRRLYSNMGELETTLRVSKIVTVPVMETLTTDGGDLVAILVNLSDYTVGADKGGNISFFDDFDLDVNQYKYLLETRMSGALTLFKSALVVSRGVGTQVTPAVPTFVPATGVVTIPGTTGVVYKMDGVVKTAGAQTAIAAGATVEVTAEPATGYYFPHNFDADWTFTRNA